MTVIAFRPRRSTEARAADSDGTPISGTFRSPRGVTGVMEGHLRLQRLVLAPRGVFVTGVFTGELRELDGTLVGRDSKRVTAPADLVRDDLGLHPLVRPLQLDLLGLPVRVESFAIEPTNVFPTAQRQAVRRSSHASGREPGGDLR